MSVIVQDSQSDRQISLKEACEKFFGGAITVASLKAEARRDNLVISKIGRAYFTTPQAIRDMVTKCRVQQEAPISGATKPEAVGQSATEASASALASAMQTAARLKRRSKNI